MSKRAAKYKRISADREGRELGVARQDEDLDDLAARRGYEVVEDYQDNDISASTASRRARPEYSRLLRDARAGKFDVVLAYTSNRLTRRMREHEDLIELAIGHGITFDYVRSPSFDLNTAAGRMVARMLAVTDASEAENISERVIRAKLKAAAEGRWRGGRRPFGFEADGVTLRPDEAAEVRRCSEALLRGDSIRSLVVDLNKRGVRTTLDREWTHVSLRKALSRARNAGLVEHNGEVVGPASWPAVVAEEVWRAVVAVLRDPSRLSTLSNVRVRPGGGLYRCGVCGDYVCTGTTGTHRGRGEPAMPVYVCRAARRAASAARHVARDANRVDALVDEFIVARLSRPDAVGLLKSAQPDVAKFHVEAAALRVRLDELAELHADGDITAKQLAIGTERIRVQLAAAEAAIADSAIGSAFDGLIGHKDVERRWAQLSVQRKRRVIDALVTVTLLPGRHGRPEGWRPGDSYFRPETVQILPKG